MARATTTVRITVETADLLKRLIEYSSAPNLGALMTDLALDRAELVLAGKRGTRAGRAKQRRALEAAREAAVATRSGRVMLRIVNVIAPIQTRGDELLIQSIFHPFEMFSKRHTGVALQLAVDGPGYVGASNGRVPFVDASAILDGSTLQLFLTNRSVAAAADVTLAPADVSINACRSAEGLTGPDAKAANSFERGDLVKPGPFEVRVHAGRASCQLPPLSFVAMTLQCS